MAESSDLLDRIDLLCGRASDVGAGQELLREMEDVLAEGYIEALAREAYGKRLARRIEALIDTIDAPGIAMEARNLARERRRADRSAREIRTRLGVMREHFLRLGGGSSVPPSR